MRDPKEPFFKLYHTMCLRENQGSRSYMPGSVAGLLKKVRRPCRGFVRRVASGCVCDHFVIRPRISSGKTLRQMTLQSMLMSYYSASSAKWQTCTEPSPGSAKPTRQDMALRIFSKRRGAIAESTYVSDNHSDRSRVCPASWVSWGSPCCNCHALRPYLASKSFKRTKWYSEVVTPLFRPRNGQKTYHLNNPG